MLTTTRTIRSQHSGSAISSKPNSSQTETLTTEASLKSLPETLEDTPDATSSLASVDGTSRSNLPDGEANPCGLQAFPVSRSPSRTSQEEGVRGKPTNATFCLNSLVLSRDADLQQCLESRLRTRLSGVGLTSFATRWKALRYSIGAAVLPALSKGARHERKRLIWVADTGRKGRQGHLPLQCLPLSAPQAFSEYGDPLARASRALDGDYSGLLLGDGVSVAVERRRTKGYGNAIVPQVAAEFIAAYCAARS